MAFVVGYKCKICEWETTKKGWRNESLRMNEHFEKHHQLELKTVKESENLVRKLTVEIEKKYLKSLSDYIESIPSKSSKRWKCSSCDEPPLPYSNKFWHIDNCHSTTLPKTYRGPYKKQKVLK